MELPKLYAKKFHSQTRYYFANWLPTTTVDCGTVGILENNFFFRPIGTLTGQGIAFDPNQDVLIDTDPSPFDLKSNKDVTVTIKLAGELSTQLPSIPEAKAGIGIEFSQQAGFLIKAAAAYEHRITNLILLEQKIKQALANDSWKREYVVVSSVLQAPYADILISQSKTAKWEFEANGSGHVGTVELGDATVGFTAKSQSGQVLDMRGSQNVTIAFQLVGLKKPLFQDLKLQPMKAHMSSVAAIYQPDDIAALRLDLLGFSAA